MSVDVAQGPHEGIAMFKNNTFDIIFMDLCMPEMNGFEACHQIRRLEKERGLKK